MNLQLTINMRPDWTTSRYNCKKLNLANNVCYDTVLLNHIDQLLNSKKINFRQYPDEYIVYNTIAHYHLINAKNIAVGYGLGELITRILKLKLIKKIAIVSPTWPMVEVFCKIFGISCCDHIDYSANAIYLANPNGMDGSCLSQAEIINLLDKFELVIIDEAYGEFATIQYSVLDIAPVQSNLIVLKTFSKSLSLAGLRLGYAIANEDLIFELQLNRPSCVVSSVSLSIIEELFDLIPDHVSRMQATKHYIEQHYDCIASHGNYVLFKEMPDYFNNRIDVKEISTVAHRMALTNLEIFKNEIEK